MRILCYFCSPVTGEAKQIFFPQSNVSQVGDLQLGCYKIRKIQFELCITNIARGFFLLFFFFSPLKTNPGQFLPLIWFVCVDRLMLGQACAFTYGRSQCLVQMFWPNTTNRGCYSLEVVQPLVFFRHDPKKMSNEPMNCISPFSPSWKYHI